MTGRTWLGAQRLARELPNARYVVIAGAGHLPPLEQPGRVRELLSTSSIPERPFPAACRNAVRAARDDAAGEEPAEPLLRLGVIRPPGPSSIAVPTEQPA